MVTMLGVHYFRSRRELQEIYTQIQRENHNGADLSASHTRLDVEVVLDLQRPAP